MAFSVPLSPSMAFSVHFRSNGLHPCQHSRIQTSVSPAQAPRASAAPSQPGTDSSNSRSGSSQQPAHHAASSVGAAGRDLDDLDLNFSLQDSLGDRLRSHAGAGTSGSSSIAAAEVERVRQRTNSSASARRQGRQQHGATANKASQFSWVDNSRGRSSRSSTYSRHSGAQWQRAPAYRRSQQREYQTKDTIGPVDPPLLTKFLNYCKSLDELYGLFFRHHHRFNHLHVSCAMNRLAWLRGPKSGALPSQQADCVDLMLTTLEAKFVEFLDLYTVREVANALWSWAKLGYQPSEASLSAILSVVTANNGALLTGRNAKPQALANLAWGACQLQCRNRHMWALLAATVRRGLRAQVDNNSSRWYGPAEFDTSSSSSRSGGGQSDGRVSVVGVGGGGESHAASRLREESSSGSKYAGIKQAAQPQQRQQRELQTEAEEYFPVDLSLIAWSYATVRVYHGPLFDDIADAAMDRLPEFCPQDMTNLLWAFAQVGHPAPALFEACVPAISSMITGFTPQGLANLAWAYTKAGLPSVDVLGPVARQASRNFHALEPVHISQLVWSMVRCGQIHRPLMQAAMAAAAAETHKYKSKELALVLWAVAVTEQPLDRTNFMAIGSALLQRMAAASLDPEGTPSSSRFCPQDMANIVYAYSKSGAQWKDMANIVYAYFTSGVYDAEVYDTAVKLCKEHREAWLSAPEAFRGTVWSLGHAGHYDADLFDMSACHLRHLALKGGVPMKVLACVLQPLAMMRHYNQECCEAVCQHMHTSVKDECAEVTHETLANMLWSLAVLGHQDLPLMGASFAWVRQRWQEQQRREAGLHEHGRWAGAVGIKQLMQYFQTYLWLQDLGTPGARDACAELPQDLIQQAHQVWRLQAERQACVSEFQLELHEAFTRMGLQPSMEHITADSLFSVDMVIQLGHCKLAVEANGPSHYTATSPHRLLGNKVLRDNFLRKRGYTVLNVAWYRWLVLLQKSGFEETDEFLWSELLQAVDSEAGKVAVAIKQRELQQGRRRA